MYPFTTFVKLRISNGYTFVITTSDGGGVYKLAVLQSKKDDSTILQLLTGQRTGSVCKKTSL